MSRFKERTVTKYIVVHCSASQASAELTAADIRRQHKNQGWMDIGYHFVIRRDGVIEHGRPVDAVGSHVKGRNSESLGICLIGGLNAKGRGEFNYTEEQMKSLDHIIKLMVNKYPDAEVLGHRDLSPDKNGDGKITSIDWLKECPCFDVRDWLKADQKETHTVVGGETVWSIAVKYATTTTAIVALNGLPNEGAVIQIGQVLRIK